MLPASTISTISTVAASVTRKPFDELALDLEPIEHRLDLRAAAMDHHRVDPDLLEQHDIAGEVARQGRRPHGVAAEFDDEGAAGEAPHIGQRLDQGRCGSMMRPARS